MSVQNVFARTKLYRLHTWCSQMSNQTDHDIISDQFQQLYWGGGEDDLLPPPPQMHPLPASSATTVVFCQLDPAAIQVGTVQFLQGILHVVIGCVLHHTGEYSRRMLFFFVVKNSKKQPYPSPTRCLCASAKVISPADLMKSFKSWKIEGRKEKKFKGREIMDPGGDAGTR